MVLKEAQIPLLLFSIIMYCSFIRMYQKKHKCKLSVSSSKCTEDASSILWLV